jgi:cytochrome P450
MEAVIAVAAFLESFPDSSLDIDAGIEWHPNPGLRGLEQLHVRLKLQV